MNGREQMGQKGWALTPIYAAVLKQKGAEVTVVKITKAEGISCLKTV